ncbi:MAG: cysteine synthase A [Anaerolineae bacterium]|nr:cysteine synthase A [Anaerolineae bacterium]
MPSTDKHCADWVTGLIGNTPVVRLQRVVGPQDAAVWAKLERHNPGGSIKDRIALLMVEAAERAGVLAPGGTIVEPTSGNTGIGLAMVGAARGYHVILVMPESASLERQQLMHAYGAELVLVSGAQGMVDAVAKAHELVERHGYWMPNQFENPANPEAHRRTTAPEILAQVPGPIDAFVASVGTGGTITGTGQVLKGHYPALKVYAIEPAESPVLSGGAPGAHKIPGAGAGFVPKVLDRTVIDEIVTVRSADAWEMTRRLARQEGLSVGISSGANACAAVDVAQRLGPGHTVVVIMPDTGERYLSTGVFTDRSENGEGT